MSAKSREKRRCKISLKLRTFVGLESTLILLLLNHSIHLKAEETQTLCCTNSTRGLWRRQVSFGASNGDEGELISDVEAESLALLPATTSTPTGHLDYLDPAARDFGGAGSAAHTTASIRARFSNEQNRLYQVSSSQTAAYSAHDLQQKVGPTFVKEPPSLIHYLNSTELVIPCSAQGNPQPTISWWHKSSQLEIGSLLDKRYVRYDNSLVISTFKAHEYEPDTHSTAYKCQASNAVGTIVSRDVVIKAVLDQDFEVGVADQFVAADNDALFRCQIPPQARDFLQVTGWLEDGQHLITGPPIGSNQPATSGSQRTLLLPDGGLYVRKVQLADANKSFKCQVKNLLSSKVSLSQLSGRLFVTEANGDGIGPRIAEGPAPISLAKSNQQLLLTCLAQGSPRPSIRWFRRQPEPNTDWQEIQPTLNETKYFAAEAGNALLLVRNLQPSDNRAKFRCIASNPFGQHQAETELRVDTLIAGQRLVEVEPRVEHINNANLQRQTVQFNCTIRPSASLGPLIGVEWLKNGRPLFEISLAQNHLTPGPSSSSSSSSSLVLPSSSSDNGPWDLNGTSIFDDPNQELAVIEHFQSQQAQISQMENLDQLSDNSPTQSSFADQLDTLRLMSNLQATNQHQQKLISSSSLNKMAEEQDHAQTGFHQLTTTSHNKQRIRQRLYLVNRDTLIYQLQVDQVRRSDRGSYQCRARNAISTLHSVGHLMLKDNPPKFLETFAGQLLTNQQTQGNKMHTQSQQQLQVSLKCIASGSPLPEISWTLSGFPIPESSRFRVGDYVTRDGLIVSFVNISNVQVGDGGLYECLAANDVGQLRHQAWLNVTGPPHIRPMPNVNAIAGRSLTIMCPAGGWPIEQILWFQNATKLPVNHRQKLFPNGTLLISELNEVTDSGQYSCQAKSVGNEALATGHVQVSIKVPPVVEPFSFAKSLQRGQRYNIMCTVVRGDLPVTIRWFKDGRALELTGDNNQVSSEPQLQLQPLEHVPTTGTGIAVKQLDPYSSTLTFSSLQSHHRGQYTCEATNEAGSANQSSTLVIHVPPEWRIEPKDVSVTVGKTAVIDCQADAFPAARIEWRLSQDLFREPPTEFKPIISSLYMRVFENGSLIIYNTQRSDAGYYLCQANNGVGPGLSRVIKLTVHVAAHFKTKIRTELVKRGQAARLKCEAIGDPPLEINWLKDKSPLYVAEEARYSVSRAQLQDGMVSELNIVDSDRSDSALFTCLAQNRYGNDDTNLQLIVQAPPDPPADIRIHEYQARSVKISWSAAYTGNSPITKYIVMYAQLGPVLAPLSNPAAENQSSGQTYTNVSIGGNESSVQLQGLIPLTEYQFHVLAVNALGSSRLPGEPIKFRTDDEAPSGQPLLVKAQPVSSHSIRVKWRAPERRSHFGSIAGFYVGYKRQRRAAPDNADTFVYKTVELMTPLLDFNTLAKNNSIQLEQECLLQGLKRNQKYLITVQAFNGRGTGPASEHVVAETWRVDVPDPPSLRLVARTTHSIHLTWRLANSPLGSSTAPTTTSGDLALSTGRQALVMRKSIADHIKSKQFSVQDIDLADVDKRTEGSNNNNLLDNDQQAANHETDLDDQVQEPILGFILTRRQMSSMGSQQQQQQQSTELQQPVEMRLPSDHLSQIVDNLNCGTRYQFNIAALNSMGSSVPSEPLVVKTEGSLPVAPDKGSLLSMNSSTVLINLSTWHNGACAMRSFEVMFKTSRSKSWTPLATHQVSSTQILSGDNSTLSPGGASQLAQRSTYPQLKGGPNNQASHLSNATTLVLEDLSSALNYDLRILATNEAGSTEAFYTFNTNGGTSSIVQRNGADDQQWIGSEFQDTSITELLSAGPMLTWILLLLFSSLLLSTVCIVLARRRHTSSSSCSLSLSSASRSNQSSGNYYTTTAACPSSQHPLISNTKDKSLANGHSSLHSATIASDSPMHQTLVGHHNQAANMLHLNEIYGHQSAPSSSSSGNQQHQIGAHLSLTDKSPYAFLAGNGSSNGGQRRANSPQGTDMTSVINGGSEAEMCLGASALNIAQQVDKQRAAEQQQQYYMAPMILQSQNHNSSTLKSPNTQLHLLSKSSTLPTNCPQQIIQQLIQQQQIQHEQQANNQHQQQMIDSLVAANMMQQQQQQCNLNDNYMSMQPAPGNSSVQDNEQQVNMAALLEQQLQQQVYATVKRGCPRPPRLCDFTIYSCPTNQQHDLQLSATLARCCTDMQQQQQQHQQLQDSELQQQQHHAVCYHPINEQDATCLQQQQQQQLLQQATSDYQSLRPVNS